MITTLSLPACLFTERRFRTVHQRVCAALAVKGALTASECARECGIDRSDVSKALGDLRAFGLIGIDNAPLWGVGDFSHPMEVTENEGGIEKNHCGDFSPTPPAVPSLSSSPTPPLTNPSSVFPPSPPTGDIPPTPRQLAERYVAIWRDELGIVGIEVPRKINPGRIRAVGLRHRDEFEGDIANWRRHCQSIRGSPFLIGENDRGWKANFDWALKPESILKVQENRYDGRPSENGGLSRRQVGPATGIAEGFARAIARELGEGGGGDFPPSVPLLEHQ